MKLKASELRQKSRDDRDDGCRQPPTRAARASEGRAAERLHARTGSRGAAAGRALLRHPGRQRGPPRRDGRAGGDEDVAARLGTESHSTTATVARTPIHGPKPVALEKAMPLL